MKLFLWLFGIVGMAYFMMYATGNELVTRYATGFLWMLMHLGVLVLVVMLVLAAASFFGVSIGGDDD